MVPRIMMTTMLRNITITCHASVYTTALIPPWNEATIDYCICFHLNLIFEPTRIV